MEQRNWPRTHDELNESPIQVRVATVEGIFNPMDPTSLEERSLNPEVADWIEEWAEDFDKDHEITVEIYVVDGRLGGRAHSRRPVGVGLGIDVEAAGKLPLRMVANPTRTSCLPSPGRSQRHVPGGRSAMTGTPSLRRSST